MTHDEVVNMKDFNEWWDSDIPITSPFRKGSPAYWAWAGWQAALREQAMIEVQRLGQEIEDFNEVEKLSNLGKQILREIKPQHIDQKPVAWISTTELLVMRGNAYAGAKDWRVNLGLEPEEGDVGLYTSPPQRTWVGLDEEDYIKAYELCDFDKDLAFEFFEDKLKEKNK
jgi:hypothetical protein